MGLIGDPRIDGAAIEAIRKYGTDGARLLTGTTDHELTTFRGTEAALTFSSGYARCCSESGRQEGP
jgi:7-keto-8-aminopelargonate synthetase-like enzyme